MRKLLLTILTVIIAFAFILTDAEAKRIGGGRSFGTKYSTSTFSKANTSSASKAAPTAAAKPASGFSRWLGPLAGLAIGGLLASLFMQNGFASGIMTWILLAAGIFLIWRLISFLLFKRSAIQSAQPMRFQTEPAVKGSPSYPPINSPSFAKEGNIIDGEVVEAEPDTRLKNFDEGAFLRQAKTVFIRLQAANDTKNLTDIRIFTSPEMFAEIQMQMQERDDEPNFTEVITITAELVNLTTDENGIIASVQFSGLIREEKGATPVYIKEIWNFHNDDVSQNWLLVGIQQAQES